MMKVFADTYYFLALWNALDQAHNRALACTVQLRGELVTTAWVLTEFADAMCSPNNRMEFISILDDLRKNPQVRIIPPDSTLFDEGIEHYASRPDKEWSLTDCISFVVMRKEGIAQALTADRHFEQAGFTALLK